MPNTTKDRKTPGIFLVWKNYQRRPEVLANLITCELKFIPHLFGSKYLRPFDYLLKLVSNIKDILTTKPSFVVAQCPPTFSALPALMTRTPYIIDAHNPLFQVEMWQNLPFSKTILKNALAIIVHNQEMHELVSRIYPDSKLFTISDPIEAIKPSPQPERQPQQILVIASFDPWDEPVDLLIETMEKLEDYNFVITANIKKLESETATRLQKLDNVTLTGFLATEEYHQVLCSSLASLVLTTSDATQPSGACEALSSDTQLVISRTTLIDKLFGEWAVLVDNSSESIVKAIRDLSSKDLDLNEYRQRWNQSIQQEITELLELVNK